MIEEICIGCEWIEFLSIPGESKLVCKICEEDTEDKTICFEERTIGPKYSETIITDDNSDEELEDLCYIVGIHHTNYDGFVEHLDSSFHKQKHEFGFDEWISYSVVPSIGADCKQAYQVGKLAYEFGNGFMVLNFEELL